MPHCPSLNCYFLHPFVLREDLLHPRICLGSVLMAETAKVSSAKIGEKAYSNDFLTQLQGIVMAVCMHQADRKPSSESAK